MDSTQTLTAVITAVLVIAVLAMIWFGWRSRLRRQAGVERLPQVPGELTPASLVADGQYVATTTAGDWLDRIAVQGLGIRTTAELSVHAEGILFDRAGVAPVFIPREALVETRETSGMAGKFVEKDGLLVISWKLGQQELDTGFRSRHSADRQPLLQAIQELISAAPQADADSGKK
ncbi:MULTISPECIES: PH-like domain-containing protein [unclassified Paenarthrobacter]|uniref:PH-like domain-containing protein n=1 Tax=unclassified Paenarthrobacter TaxID=2634190 RepID=UPI003CF39BBC